MIRIHFPNLKPGKPSFDLPSALHLNGATGAQTADGPEKHKYDELNARVGELFEPTDLEQAQVLIYPYRAETGPETAAVAQEARRRGIACLFLSWGDWEEVVNVPYGTVYRHSLFSDQRLPCETAMPAVVSDPRTEMGIEISPRPKRPSPSVGFCGFVSNPITRAIYQLMGRKRKSEGLTLRARVLAALRRTPGVDCDFITRQMYWAGTRGRFHRRTAGQYEPRKEFWNNVLNTDYTLCIRGAGNFSYRFYEVMAAGRIPLFINTRCVLPFDDEIDWKKHCVWVEESEIASAGKILKAFHDPLSPEEFVERQRSNRRLWESHLSVLNFYRRAIEKEIARCSAMPSDSASAVPR